MIHPTAIVHPGAELDASVEIGPYSIIADNVYIGSRTVVGPHVVIEPYVSISADCRIFQYASIGAIPQAVKFCGEKHSSKSVAVVSFASLLPSIGERILVAASQRSAMRIC